MKLSIRYKLLFYMTVNILIFTVVLFGFNIFFTKELYINHKKDVLLDSSKKIQNILENLSFSEYYTMEDELNRLERSIGAAIFISTAKGEIYYPPAHSPGGSPHNDPFLPFDSISENEAKKEKIGDGYSFFMIMEDPNFEFETLRYQTKLNNGIDLLIWLPMSEISESIGTFNKIVLFAALIVLVCSVFWSLFISNKFTKPIKQMNNTARKISTQNFSETIDISGNDEIAQLAVSINEISHKLSISINQLSEKNLQLEKDIIYEKKLDKMRKEFVSGVSHELKTPLFLIQGYAEGLKKVSHKEEKRNFYCDVIMNETEKMDKLIKDLLDLSQIEAGVFAVKGQTFDIVDLARCTLHKFKPLFESKEVNVELDMPNFLAVHADPVRTEQIIVNYLNNAIDHLDDKKELKVTINTDVGKAKISVFNSGESIPDDVADKIWTSFYKADDARTREYGGTGLGLSIVRAIQEGHNNGYGVDNMADGVVFWITLNLAEQ